MNWDKQSIAAVVIGAAVLIGWFIFGPQLTGTKQAAPAAQTQQVEQVRNDSAPAPAAQAPQQDKSADNKEQAQSANSPAPATPAAPAAVAKKTAVQIWAKGSVYHIQPATATVEKVTLPKDKFSKQGTQEPLEITSKIGRAHV